MNRNIEAIKIKQDRGQILFALNLFYPDKVMLKTLRRTTCGPEGSPSLFRKDIEYLRAKAYIDLSRNLLCPEGEWEDQLCVLTASGLEVAQGTAKDPAIEL